MNSDVLNIVKKCGIEKHWKVLEVGSLWVNGSPREVVKCDDYTGVDFRDGKGVDVVMDAGALYEKWTPETFDAVICCETLEHCKDWKLVLTQAWRVLKVGGVFCLTTPTRGKGRHNHPDDYWRWTLEQYGAIFSKQDVRKLQQVWAHGIGAIVVKVSEDLDLSVIPEEVPR